MQNKIKSLLQLQELDIILAEARIVHKSEKDSELVKEKTNRIREHIDSGTLSKYDRLIKQGLAVVQEINGMCMGCNLSVPVGDLNRIMSDKIEPICPNCGKFLAVANVMEAIIEKEMGESAQIHSIAN